MRVTNWQVITGAPCSGKTAVIDELRHRGFQVVPEAARAYIDTELGKGKNLDEIKSDPVDFENRILEKKVALETALDPEALVFLDRAVPDSLAYYQAAGLDTAAVFEKSRLFRYRRIFLFERLIFENDAVRSENDAEARRLEILLEGDYRALGYRPVRVPLMPVDERADFIIKRL